MRLGQKARPVQLQQKAQPVRLWQKQQQVLRPLGSLFRFSKTSTQACVRTQDLALLLLR